MVPFCPHHIPPDPDVLEKRLLDKVNVSHPPVTTSGFGDVKDETMVCMVSKPSCPLIDHHEGKSCKELKYVYKKKRNRGFKRAESK